MNKFQNKYRIEPHRKPNWDYSAGAYYFITLCCQDQKNYLGKIENHKMILSDYGKIVEREWHISFALRKELILDEFILMPNHLHAIIILDPEKAPCPTNQIDDDLVQTPGRASQTNDGKTNDEKTDDGKTHGRASLLFMRKPKSISSFIAGFKSATTNKIDDFIDEMELPLKKFNRNNRFWHHNYHDHIIRNHEAYLNIKNYIIKNPSKWDDNKFH